MTAGAGTVSAPVRTGRADAPWPATRRSTRSVVAGPGRRPGPTTSAVWARAAMAATAAGASTTPGSVSGRPMVMSSGTRPAMTGCSDAGTESVTRPAPVRSAAVPASSAAPAQSREPHTASSDPNVPLCPSAGRSGRNGATSAASSRMRVGERLSERLMGWWPRVRARPPSIPERSRSRRPRMRARTWRSRSSRRASMSTGNTNVPPWVRMPNAMATAYSCSWLMDTAIRVMPSWSARRSARSCSCTVGWPVGSRTISISRQPTPRTPSPRTLLTASLAAQRPARFSGRSRT